MLMSSSRSGPVRLVNRLLLASVSSQICCLILTVKHSTHGRNQARFGLLRSKHHLLTPVLTSRLVQSGTRSWFVEKFCRNIGPISAAAAIFSVCLRMRCAVTAAF